MRFRYRIVAVTLLILAACGGDEDEPDGSGSDNCPASGVPAVVGCPCPTQTGEYCCGVGHGVLCEDKVWLAFYDSPCHPLDEDAGVPSIQCRP